jgi:hypothetical protein
MEMNGVSALLNFFHQKIVHAVSSFFSPRPAGHRGSDRA